MLKATAFSGNEQLTVAQSMPGEFWGYLTLLFWAIIFFCIFAQLCVIAVHFLSNSALTTWPSIIGFTLSILDWVMVLSRGLDNALRILNINAVMSTILISHPFVFIGFFVWIRHIKGKIEERNRCPICTHCGYNLTDNLTGQCPECGEPIPTHLKTLVLLKRIDKLG